MSSSQGRRDKGQENGNHGQSSSRGRRQENKDDLEFLDPTPDIYALFVHYNKVYFSGILGAVTLEWSKRMTLCAGLCYYQGRAGGCRIKLSEPLLTLRPRSDLINTLLHEMIHAYFFIRGGYARLDRDGHGPDFQQMMHRINELEGTGISVYHSFHDEVNHLKTHWWKCNGPCVNRGPYYGMVKRSMNRAPGPNDLWWEEHKKNCGGVYTKVKEPEPKTKKKKAADGAEGSGGKKRKVEETSKSDVQKGVQPSISDFLKTNGNERKRQKGMNGVETGSQVKNGGTGPDVEIIDAPAPVKKEIELVDVDADDEEQIRLAIQLSLTDFGPPADRPDEKKDKKATTISPPASSAVTMEQLVPATGFSSELDRQRFLCQQERRMRFQTQLALSSAPNQPSTPAPAVPEKPRYKFRPDHEYLGEGHRLGE